jgi:FKBP-type peptidyl-prolyl cis-trans isomerase SlyD
MADPQSISNGKGVESISDVKSVESISDGKIVEIHFILTDDNGETLDSSEGQEPLAYLHGAGNIVPGLERQLTGHSMGDKVKAAVPPEEAYGEIMGDGPQEVQRSNFPDDIEVAPGMAFEVAGEDGEPFMLRVVAVDDDKVFVDDNHPLAGMNLNFDIEIVTVRPATQEEIDHGHPHS